MDIFGMSAYCSLSCLSCFSIRSVLFLFGARQSWKPGKVPEAPWYQQAMSNRKEK